MRRQEPESIGDVLRSALDSACMTARLDQSQACAVWPTVVGPDIASRCGRPQMKGDIMTVGVRSASLRQDLHLSRSSLIKCINRTVGRDVVSDIRFVAG